MGAPTTPEPQRSIQRLLSIVLGYDPPSAAAGDFLIQLENNPEPYVVPGLPAVPDDYYPTASPTSLVQTTNAAWADFLTPDEQAGHTRGATGGFDDLLSLTVGFGTGVRFVEDGVFDDLIADSGDRIDTELLSPLIELCRDKYVYRVVRQFLIGDGGRFLAVPGGGPATAADSGWMGRYSRSEMSISIDTARDAWQIEKTLVHELLHYVFHKSDSPLAPSVLDARSRRWTPSHPVIALLAARIECLRNVLTGSEHVVLDFSLEYGQGTFAKGHQVTNTDLWVWGPPQDAGILFRLEDQAARQAWSTADRDALNAATPEALAEALGRVGLATDSPEYLRALVSAGILPLLLYREAIGREIYPEEIYSDVAFLVAQYGVIARRLDHENILAATRKGSYSPLDPEGTARMKSFVRSFVLALQDDPFHGVDATERALRDW